MTENNNGRGPDQEDVNAKKSNKNMKGNRERQEEGCIKREAKLMG